MPSARAFCWLGGLQRPSCQDSGVVWQETRPANRSVVALQTRGSILHADGQGQVSSFHRRHFGSCHFSYRWIRRRDRPGARYRPSVRPRRSRVWQEIRRRFHGPSELLFLQPFSLSNNFPRGSTILPTGTRQRRAKAVSCRCTHRGRTRRERRRNVELVQLVRYRELDFPQQLVSPGKPSRFRRHG